MADPVDSTSATRRLFLASGSAVAVFGAVSAAAHGESELIRSCRRALTANSRQNELLNDDEEDPRLAGLYDEEMSDLGFAVDTPAKTMADIKAKAELLRAQLPLNSSRDGLWPGADTSDRLVWSIIRDLQAIA